jgi:sigma-B regulation protein RsbU (phosphoserine phosphatase)
LPRFLRELNHYLLASTPDDMFVTLFLGILDQGTGRLTYVNAGHPPPLLLASDSDEPVRLAKGSSLLGVLSEVAYEEGKIELSPGSLLALFSDGVTDARNEKGERFLERRLVDVLRGTRSSPATDVLFGILAAVERFTVLSERNDDIALMIVRRQVGSLTRIGQP